MHPLLRVIATFALISAATTTPGCSRPSPKSPAPNAPAPPAPSAPAPVASSAFATPESLVLRINELAAKGYLRLDELADLCYAENEAQQRNLGILKRSVIAWEVDEAAFERFNKTLNQLRDHRIHAQIKNVALSATEDRRATATLQDQTWNLSTLTLIKVGGGWWIAARTWGDSGGLMITDPLQEIALAPQAVLDGMNAVDGEIARRIRAGEFSSVLDARKAYQLLFQEYDRAHPDLPAIRKKWASGGK